MDLNQIAKIGTRAAGTVGMRLRNVSPEVLVGAGIVGLLAAGVVAARATLKAQPALAAARGALDSVEEQSAADIGYAKGASTTDRIYIYRTTTFELAKLYLPAVTLGVAGVACVLGGHHLLRQRNVALVAAYKVLETSYGEYRKRVRNAVGEEKEFEIYRDIRTIEETDSKGKKIKKKIEGPDAGNGYGRFFDPLNSTEYKENATLNLAYITSVQRHFNLRLNMIGYVFLNEVYEALGMAPTSAGQVVGWMCDKNNGPLADGYIDFGIDNPHNEGARRFIHGDERAVFLDFNVDGNICHAAF